MVVKVTIDTRTRYENGYSLKLSFAAQGKTVLCKLGLFAREIEDFDKQTFVLYTPNKKLNQEYVRHNSYIQSELSRARNLLLSLQLDGKDDISPIEFRNLFLKKSGKKEEITFTSYFQSFIVNKSGRTAEIYTATLNKINKFSCYSELKFDDITISWLESFDRYMKTEEIKDYKGDVIRVGLQTNARAIHFRNIRAVFNKAIDEEAVGLDKYPFRRFKIDRERTRKRALALQQLRDLFNYPGNQYDSWAIDMCKLVFYLIGINTIDLFNLNIYENGRLHYRRAKTGALYGVKVEPEVVPLLEKYKGANSLFCFQNQFSKVHSFTQKINKRLKMIAAKTAEYERIRKEKEKEGEILNVKPVIPVMTTYSLRHTWATLAAELDIPKETIAAALGHSQNATVTDVYINFNQKKVDEANRKVIDYVWGKDA